MKGWWLAAASLIGSCTASPPTEPAEPLTVWLFGCEHIGEACAVATEPEPIHLWVETTDPVAIHLGGMGQDLSPTPVDGGQRFIVEPPTEPQTLSVVDERGRQRWSMALIEAPTLIVPDTELHCPDPPEGLGDADRATIEAHCAWRAMLDAESEEERAAAAKLLPTRLERAAEGFAAAGFHDQRAKTLYHAAFMANQNGTVDEVRTIINGIASSERATSQWHWHQVHATLQIATENYDDANDSLVAAQTIETRLDLPTTWVEVTTGQLANLAGLLGDLDSALAAHRIIAKQHPITDACDPVAPGQLGNVAWFELLRQRTGAAPTAGVDPAAIFADVAAAYDQCGGNPTDRAIVAVNQALLAWSLSRWEQVLTHLERLKDAPNLELQVWMDALKASALYELGEFDEAHAAADRAVASAGVTTVDAAVFALLIAADIEIAQGHPGQAEQRLIYAQNLMFDAIPRLPSYTDRSAFIGMRFQVTPRLISLLASLQIADGRTQEAMRTVRLSRVRALRTLNASGRLSSLTESERTRWASATSAYEEARQALLKAQRNRWSLSQEELVRADQAQSQLRDEADRRLGELLDILGNRPSDTLRDPGPTERIVIWFPTDERWIGLVASQTEVVARPGPAASTPTDQLADELVASIADDLEGVDRLSILPWGQVHDLDLHLATFNGGALLDSMEVVWSLDLSPRASRAASGPTLVVGDPSENLPFARGEAAAAAGALHAEALMGSSATVDALRNRLSTLDRLHFAGHGRLDDSQSWRSGLTLADGTLDVADLLSLSRSPRLVVLSGCETGRSSSQTRVASLGVAQALLMVGSEAVVASSRPVDDRATAVGLADLMAGVDSAEALSAALHKRQRERQGTADAGAWRVWIP